jgi:LysM repeat protein
VKKYPSLGALLLLLLLPLLAGCFQQAGEAFQPANSTGEPLTAQETPTLAINIEDPNGGTVPTDDPGQTNFPGTATLPSIDITVISPTRELPATATVPGVISTIDSTQPTADVPTFRPPSQPLGPVTPDTPVPTTSIGIATTTPSGLITPTALPGVGGEPTGSDECSYTIQNGDTLFRVAIGHDTTVADITAANPGINPNLIQPGQVITLPGCTPGGSPSVGVPTTPPDIVVNPPAGGGTSYTVESGDTLFSIAQRFGVTVQAIVDANNLTNPNSLDVGQQLTIPTP